MNSRTPATFHKRPKTDSIGTRKMDFDPGMILKGISRMSKADLQHLPSSSAPSCHFVFSLGYMKSIWPHLLLHLKRRQLRQRDSFSDLFLLSKCVQLKY